MESPLGKVDERDVEAIDPVTLKAAVIKQRKSSETEASPSPPATQSITC